MTTLTTTASCVCPPDFCVGVPGDNDPDEPRLACRACLALDPEQDCLRPEVTS